MQEISFETIKKRSVKGVVALTTRTFILQIIAFIATFLLTLFLTPEIFGVFYVVSAIISFLNYFSDIGLAAALIQKQTEITQKDLGTTFVIQQTLVMLLVGISLIFSENIALFYNLNQASLVLLRALLVSFALSSLKTIPSVLLERQLAFHRLVIPQIAETIGFYAVAVYLAWSGYGISSFTWAVLVRAVVGVVAIYIVMPWKPVIAVSRESAKKLISFGLPFQANSFLALLKDDLLTVFLGKVLPLSHVGYIGWAKKWAEVPLRLIMDSVIRVTFPAYSRIAHDKLILSKAINKTIFGLAIAIFPISTALLFFIGPLVSIIPKYNKWEPALVSFYLFIFSSLLAALSTPLMNTLNAVGRIHTTLKFMIAWTILTWVLTLILLPVIGFNGVAVSLLLITSSIYFVVRVVKSIALFSFGKNIVGAVGASIVQGLFYYLVLSLVPHSYVSLFVVGILGGILYVSTLLLLQKEKVRTFIKSVRGNNE